MNAKNESPESLFAERDAHNDRRELTANEFEVLAAIDASEYGDDDLLADIWAFSVADHCKTLRGKAISGTISSLAKKGFVRCQDYDRDSIICMTDAGAAAYIAQNGGTSRKPVQP